MEIPSNSIPVNRTSDKYRRTTGNTRDEGRRPSDIVAWGNAGEAGNAPGMRTPRHVWPKAIFILRIAVVGSRTGICLPPDSGLRTLDSPEATDLHGRNAVPQFLVRV